MTLIQLFEFYRRDLGYGAVAAFVCVLRSVQLKHTFRNSCVNASIVAIVAFGMANLLELFYLEPNKYGYLASVFLGYLGVDTLLGVLADRFPLVSKFRNKDKSL
jgi:hypothetical protein